MPHKNPDPHQPNNNSQQNESVNTNLKPESENSLVQKLFNKLPAAKTANKKFKFWPHQKKHQILLTAAVFLVILLTAVLVIGWHTYRTGLELKHQAMTLQTNLNLTYNEFKSQNLPAAEGNLSQAQEQLAVIQNTYQKLSLYQHVPWIKHYYQDGLIGLEAADEALQAGAVALKAVTPYADILGFEGEESFEGGTTEDRIGVILQTMDVVMADLDEIEQHLQAAAGKLAQIDANRYPEEFRGTQIKPQIIKLQTTVAEGLDLLTNFRPVIEQLPAIAGSEEPKQYLVLFQNNNELRPTGGFLTAYSIINLENGKVIPEKSDDIYVLDQKFNQRIAIPDSLSQYLTTERYWNLRDMNISPDFKISMDTFYEHYTEVPGEPDDIDGIIAVDTQVLTRLLEILGPVEVPGYGTFSAEIDERCDCPQVVYALSEIITKPTPYIREDRKGILGPMMQAILHKTYEAPKLYWADLFAMSWNMIQGKHIQLYFLDEEAQLAAENTGAAGRLTPVEGDFLAIVDANLGGAKSNLFTEYKVMQYVTGPSNGKLNKTVEITYRNTREASNCDLEAGELCLNATAPTWHRLYLPAGAELKEAQGFAQEVNLYEKLGFQVIDGFFKLDPLGAAKIIVDYTVPYELPNYQLTLWKQGGVKSYDTIIDVNGNQTQLLIEQDTLFQENF